MMPPCFLHSVPFHVHPCGQTGGGPGSVTGQVSSDAAGGEAAGSCVEELLEQARTLPAANTITNRMRLRCMSTSSGVRGGIGPPVPDVAWDARNYKNRSRPLMGSDSRALRCDNHTKKAHASATSPAAAVSVSLPT